MLPCRRPFPPAGSELPSGQVDPEAGQCGVPASALSSPGCPESSWLLCVPREVPHLAVLGAVLIMKAQTWSHFHREIYRNANSTGYSTS